jgi:hypothetical protein
MVRNDFYSIITYIGAAYAELSVSLKDFTTSGVSFAPGNSDYIYIGRYKPFSQFFLELSTANTAANSLAFEYWNGTAWTALTKIDETVGGTKSGFIYFEKPTDWAETTVDTQEFFYVRFQPSVSWDAGTIAAGLSVLFSNDLDLTAIRSNIVSKLNNGNSWIAKHEAAKKQIIQKIRNRGNRKVKQNAYEKFTSTSAGSLLFSNINEFDFHQPFELREASKWYTLSLIYLGELSDEANDKWEVAGMRYQDMADEAMGVYMLQLDTDDDGELDQDENKSDTRVDLSWE